MIGQSQWEGLSAEGKQAGEGILSGYCEELPKRVARAIDRHCAVLALRLSQGDRRELAGSPSFREIGGILTRPGIRMSLRGDVEGDILLFWWQGQEVKPLLHADRHFADQGEGLSPIGINRHRGRRPQGEDGGLRFVAKPDLYRQEAG